MFNIFKKKIERIYFDSASAVPVLDIAKKSFLKTTNEVFANASSIHTEGEKSKEVLFEARKKIAKFIHARSENIYFASSTTEANNIFIKGIIKKGDHIIYTKSDHSAIVDVVGSLKTDTTNIIPNKIGKILVEDVVKNLKENTKLICFSLVHSELGTIQDTKKIVLAVREEWEKKFSNNNFPKFFVDASQAIKYESIDVSNLLIDGLSFGASKVGSVAGCAVLYIKNGTKLESIISGGGQEEGVRSGTENILAIVACADTLEFISNPHSRTVGKEYVYALRNYCIVELQKNFNESEVEVFGDTKFKYNKFFENSAPHILLLSLKDMLGEETCLRLDAKGISVSTATACSLLEGSGSNFLKCIGEPVLAKETIRLSFSPNNTKKEIDYFVAVLKDIKKKFLDVVK